MHSLISAPVLGFDLARAPHGAQLAAVLRRCLALGPGDLAILAAGHRQDAARDEAWREVGLATTSAPGLGPVLAAAGRVLAGPEAGAEAGTALAALSAAPLGNLETLLRCVRHDVLDWTWARSGELAIQDDVADQATSVVCDAVTAAALIGTLRGPAAHRLSGPWLAAMAHLPVPADDVGPCAPGVLELLAAAAALDGTAVAALVEAAVPDRTVPGRWAQAVHQASWAVHLAGRVRPAAAAQLLLVEAVHAAAVPAQPLALGAWRMLSGAVQAAVVHDVLDDTTAHELLGPCRLALALAL